MEKIKWGIIGTGWIARKFADALKGIEDAELYAVASRTEEKAINFAEKVHAEKSYGSYESLATDPEVDAVYIATPHPMHVENTILCLKNKKAVLCEKPIAINAEETKKMVLCARENRTLLMEAMWTRFLPINQFVKEAIENGDIGSVRWIFGHFGFSITEDYPLTGRLLNKELGGGAMLDVGIYPLSYVHWIMKKSPIKINKTVVRGNTDVDMSTVAEFVYDQDEIAVISASFTANLEGDVKVIGTRGSIVIPNFYRAVECMVKKQSGETLHKEMPHRVNGYEYQIEAFQKCLRGDMHECNIMPLDESVEIMELMDNILQG